jgi:hypothetical protein
MFMKLTTAVDQLRHEIKALQGDDIKHKTYTSQRDLTDETAARQVFSECVQRLFDVNSWSSISAFTSDFVLHDSSGTPKPGSPVQIDDYVRISLPGPVPESWVRVTSLVAEENLAEFTVHPCHEPGSQSTETRHFFRQESSSTFRVERQENSVVASEIGRDERINNEGGQAGEHALINTAIAEMGWLFYQEIQWKALTDYLVGI